MEMTSDLEVKGYELVPNPSGAPVKAWTRGVLQAAGGDLDSLMKITTYITKIEDFPAVAEARRETFTGELPASTLIVVKSLFHPDFLIEVEGVAAV